MKRVIFGRAKSAQADSHKREEESAFAPDKHPNPAGVAPRRMLRRTPAGSAFTPPSYRPRYRPALRPAGRTQRPSCHVRSGFSAHRHQQLDGDDGTPVMPPLRLVMSTLRACNAKKKFRQKRSSDARPSSLNHCNVNVLPSFFAQIGSVSCAPVTSIDRIMAHRKRPSAAPVAANHPRPRKLSDRTVQRRAAGSTS